MLKKTKKSQKAKDKQGNFPLEQLEGYYTLLFLFMTTVLQLRERIRSMDIDVISQNSIEETKDEIVKKQKEQLLQGLNAKGEKIGRYRSNKYARAKNQMNPLPGLGVPDLKLTGAFHAGINVTINTETFKTESTDSKGPDLEAKYGNEILGLNEESKDEYVKESLRPEFLKRIRKITGL